MGWPVASYSFCVPKQIYGYDELQMLQSRLPMVSGVWGRLGASGSESHVPYLLAGPRDTSRLRTPSAPQLGKLL